jgi:hypothetical protein
VLTYQITPCRNPEILELFCSLAYVNKAVDLSNTLNPELRLNNICEFSFYFIENTMRPCFEDQLVSSV